MSKKSPAPPAAPDYAAITAAQGAANKDAVATSARVNAIDTYGPYGQTTYQFGNRGGMTDIPVAQYTTLNPSGQQMYDTQQQIGVDLAGRARDALNAAPRTPFTLGGTPYDPRSYDTSALQPYQAYSAPRQASIWGGPLPQLPQTPAGPISGQTPYTLPAPGSMTQPGVPTATTGNPTVTGAPPPSGPPQNTPQAPASGTATPPTTLAFQPPGSRPTDPSQLALWSGQQLFGTIGNLFTGGLFGSAAQAAPAPNSQTGWGAPGAPAQPGGAPQAPTSSSAPAAPSPALWGGAVPQTASTVPYRPQPQIPGYNNAPGRPQTLPYDPTSYGDVSQIDRSAANTVLNEFMRMQQPQFDLQTRRLNNDLENRGIPVGSEAWRRATGDLNRTQDSAVQGAVNQAYTRGHEVAGDTISREQALRAAALSQSLQLHNQGNADWLQRLQVEQNLRGQIIGEDQMVRNQGINDASLYLQGAPALGVPQAPQVPTYQVQPVDHMQAANMQYQGQLNQYQAAAQQRQSTYQGLGNLAQSGAMLWMMSSSVLKEDIGAAESFLARAKALPIASWRYSPEAAQFYGADTELHIGPMAEKFAELFGGDGLRVNVPDAVFSLWKAFQELAAKVDRMEDTANEAA